MTAITGAFRNYAVATTTAATTLSTPINKEGYAFGTITNPSAVARTVTYYGMHIKDDGTQYGPYTLHDEDGADVTQIVGATEMWQLPLAVAGVPVLFAITTTGATTGVTNMLIHLER
jgi:hypothetical protein